MLKKSADVEMLPEDLLVNSESPEPKAPTEPQIMTNAGALWDMIEVMNSNCIAIVQPKGEVYLHIIKLVKLSLYCVN